MLLPKLVGSGFLVIAAASACAGRGTSTPGAGADVCAASAAEANAQLQPIVAANLACDKDADCFVVSLSATCLDACSAAVNGQGRGELDRAVVLIEARECKMFKQAGCKLTIPPCAPPRTPTCQSGRCQL